MRIRIAVLVAMMTTTVTAAQARQVQIDITLRSQLIGLFNYSKRIEGAAAEGLGAAQLSDFRPYVAEAQKALADREGYSTRQFGSDSARLATQADDVRVTATDVDTHQVIFSSREAVDSSGGPKDRAARTAAPARPAASDADSTTSSHASHGPKR